MATDTRQLEAVAPEGAPQTATDSQERLQRIAAAAYYKSEARGFAPGRELDDWLDAEREIDAAQTGSSAGAA